MKNGSELADTIWNRVKNQHEHLSGHNHQHFKKGSFWAFLRKHMAYFN